MSNKITMLKLSMSLEVTAHRHIFLQVKLTVSGDGGCPGLAVLRAVEEALSLAPDTVTPLLQLEVEHIARANHRSSGPATPDNVEVGFVFSGEKFWKNLHICIAFIVFMLQNPTLDL